MGLLIIYSIPVSDIINRKLRLVIYNQNVDTSLY